MGWVIQGEIAKLNQGLTHVEKFVLLTFSSFALDDGSSCYPALGTVAERTILSERTVQRVVAKFVKNGVMVVKGKHGNRQFKYQIDLVRAKALHYKSEEDKSGSPDSQSAQTTDSHDTQSGLATDSHDSLSASHDSLSASHDCVSGNPVKEPVKEAVKESSRASTREAGARDPGAVPTDLKPSVFESQFDDWWALTPKKVGKGQARLKFKAALKKTDFQTLKAGIIRYARQVAGQDVSYIAHPATWLYGERWLDEIEPEGKTDEKGQIGSSPRVRRQSPHAAMFATGARAARDPDSRMSGEPGLAPEGTALDEEGKAGFGGRGSCLPRLPRPRGAG